MGLVRRVKEEAIRAKTIMPRFLQLEVSKDCNLNCAGCFRMDNTSIADLKGERNLTLEATKKVVKMVPMVRTIILLGDGEPLMNPELGEILEYLSSKGISSWIVTNGTLLTQEIVDKWENNKVVQIQISLHDELYNGGKADSSFEKVLNSLKIAGKSRIPSLINFLMYQESMKDLPDIVRLAQDTNCKGINVLSPIFLTGSDIKGSITRAQDNEQNRAFIQEALTLAKKAKISWVGEKPTLSPIFRRCNFPFALPYITLGGDVYGCCYTVGGGRTEWYQDIPKEIPSSNYLIGNIFTTPFKDIWRGEACKTLRDYVKATEKLRGTRITPQELQLLRATEADSRFSYCKDCLWRWGSAC